MGPAAADQGPDRAARAVSGLNNDTASIYRLLDARNVAQERLPARAVRSARAAMPRGGACQRLQHLERLRPARGDVVVVSRE